MCDRNLFLEIVTVLEEQGLGRDEYQLQRVIDIEALEQIVESAGADLEVKFSVDEYRLCMTQSDVQVLAGP
ncbi:hypothetical protein [Natrinema halophilum]|uniref:hypothetical protein n=1 Tax=Natrinema halophilum TaxID=1699371 RepID=UPI001F3656EA|nr:hypothetical protein [Natrinema halophilum]UHQ96273.1 hypothetical protein HYG82_21665 [Natrinema halophilum]